MDAPGELPPPTVDGDGSHHDDDKEREGRNLTPSLDESDDGSEVEDIRSRDLVTSPQDAATIGYRRPTVDISCPISHGLTSAAKLTYTSSIYRFSVAFDNEISRQELGARGNDEGPAEVNVNMVEMAYDNVRYSTPPELGNRSKSRVSSAKTWSPIVAAVCGAIAGIFGNNLPEPWAWVFLIVFILGVVVAMLWPDYEVRRRS